jgi:hypothetical protein
MQYGDACPYANGAVATSSSSLAGRLSALLASPAWAQTSLQYSVVQNSIGDVVGQVTGDGIAVESTGITTMSATIPVVPYQSSSPAELRYKPTTGGTVTDGQLEWEVKSGTSGPNFYNNTYSVAAAASYIAQLNTSAYAGHTDWRMPTYGELEATRVMPCLAFGAPCLYSIFGPTGTFDPNNSTVPLGYLTSTAASPSVVQGVFYAANQEGSIATGFVRGVRTAAPSCSPNCGVGTACLANSNCASQACVQGMCKCQSVALTLHVSDIPSGQTFVDATWPGGQQAQSSFDPGCSVTINQPSGDIDTACTSATPFSVANWTGYSSCAGAGGDDGGGCHLIDCPPSSFGGAKCCDEFPECGGPPGSQGGTADAQYTVQCVQ